MNGVFLNDEHVRSALYPFAEIRRVADIRIGILTLREKWTLLRPDLTIYPAPKTQSVELPANVIPDATTVDNLVDLSKNGIKNLSLLEHPWQIFQQNDTQIRSDFQLITKGRSSAPIPSETKAIVPQNIFIEDGATINFCILNASDGPIYIGRNAILMEGSVVRGPAAICENAIVKVNTRIYGATTIGPHSVVGGEIKNSVILGYSNKAHDGYLGDSVIGEWCNIGAGTSNSNVKNSAGEIKAWNNSTASFYNAGMKCGLLLGDYSRAAINTSFNSGTVTGVCCNIFGEGLTPKFIPSFSWGFNPVKKYMIDRAIADVNNWKKLKGHFLSEDERQTLKSIFETI